MQDRLDELIKFWQKLKFTSVFITHNIEEALKVGKKIVILSNRPARVMHLIELESKIPRDINDENMVSLKLDIQKRFQNVNNA